MRDVELQELENAILDIRAELQLATEKETALKANLIKSQNSIEASLDAYHRNLELYQQLLSEDVIEMSRYIQLKQGIANCSDWLEQFRIEHSIATTNLKDVTDQIAVLVDALNALLSQRQNWNRVVKFAKVQP